MPRGIYPMSEKRKKALLESSKKAADVTRGKKRSEMVKNKIRQTLIGRKFSQETLRKMKDSHVGKKIPSLVRKKMSASQVATMTPEKRLRMANSHSKEKSHFWKGGLTENNRLIRGSTLFALWRESVFIRDDWTCQKTGTKGGKLHPHHIKNFAEFPELRFDLSNGITLSEKSHYAFHKKYGRKNNTREQLEEFLCID